jgi:mannan endo-1,4-beta-mannosidase
MKSPMLSFSLLLPAIALSQTVNFAVTVNDSPAAISPLIYGTNQLMSGGENWSSMRLGGNRLTGYNWENNASNAGSDYIHSSDNYLPSVSGVPGDSSNVPGIVVEAFYKQAHAFNAYPLVTLQMAGFVARDKNGVVDSSQTAPSSRWAYAKPVKGAPLLLTPDTSDNSVYMDELVNFLVHTYGTGASGTGIRGYALDNEPALWPSTHPRIHPLQPTCRELVQKSVSLSRSVKTIDPSAEVFGPVEYGFSGYYDFQSAPDWNSVKAGKSYTWFLDYYLDQLKLASDTSGRRLLDVLDLHWYPEAQGSDGNRITNANATSVADRQARIQAPRSLWDSHYKETSWIAQYFSSYLPLIPKVAQSIKNYYPGTKLGFTEFEYGGETDISGALAIDDVLGIFGKYGVYFATYWEGGSQTPYISAAYKMYRNYDGNNSTFGDLSLPSRTGDSVNTSMYGSLKRGSHELHLIVINKNPGQAVTGRFALSSGSPSASHITILSGKVWELGGSSPQIRSGKDVSDISDSSFSYSLDSASVYHIVLQTSVITGVSAPAGLPAGFALCQNYPNPFNPATVISYEVPADGQVTLKVYDLLGREVGTLVNRFQRTGRYSVTFDASRLASGVYVCGLASGGHTAARRMLLMK